MTTVATRGRVCPTQCEMRIARVVERGFFPTAFVVTLLTFIAVGTAMHIVQRMTGSAGFWGIFVALANMTRRTIDLLVPALQCELCFIVIEASLLPSHWAMARCTLLSQRAFMTIVFAMTRETLAACGAKFFPLLMTARTS